MSKSARKNTPSAWSSRELELADDLSPGPELDTAFFNTQLSTDQRRRILRRRGSSGDDSPCVIENVQEEELNRVWGTPGQAAVRTILLTFARRNNSRTTRQASSPLAKAVTRTHTRSWKQGHNNQPVVSGSTVTTTFIPLPANIITVVAKSVTVPCEIKGSSTKAERKRQSFLAEASLLRHASDLNKQHVRVPEIYYFSCSQDSKTFVFIMEDLRRTFPKQHSAFSKKHAQVALAWLARFHAIFWEGRIPSALEGTWDEGSFWNLSKKPIQGENTIQKNWQTSIQDLNLPVEYHGLCDKLLSKAKYLDERLSSVATGIKQEGFISRPSKRAKERLLQTRHHVARRLQGRKYPF